MTIEMRNLQKTYGEGVTAVHALRDVVLDIPQGQFTVILGPSGSGKTTMLNLIGAIDEPTGGTLQVDGIDLGSLDDQGRIGYRRTEVGLVFQFFNLIPTLTALENVELVAGLSGDDAHDRSVEALEGVGLGERVGHFPSQMSGGEQQRVAIARALAKQPSILLCDEPTGELDFETGRMILAQLRQVNRDNGQTVLLVTHNAALAAMADRVIRLRSGEVVEDRSIPQPVGAEELTW